MTPSRQIKTALSQKFEKVKEAPSGFDFFVSIHDFIKFIESTPSLTSTDLGLPLKYSFLREIYQGVEDLDIKTTEDLGHNRYAAIRDLNLIRNNDTSENNPFWKRREVFRKIAGETYKILDAHLSE